MVKSLTVDQAHAALKKLGEGYGMFYLNPDKFYPRRPDIDNKGWYIIKEGEYYVLDATQILKEDSTLEISESLYTQLFDQSGVCSRAKYLEHHGIDTEIHCYCSKDVDFHCTAIGSLEAILEHIKFTR